MSKNWKPKKVENPERRGDQCGDRHENGMEIGVRPAWRSAFSGFGGGGMVAGFWVWFLLWVSWYGGEAGVWWFLVVVAWWRG